MSIWIVDDEINLANGLKRAFEKNGHSAQCFYTLHELQEALAVGIPSLVFLDQCLPDGNGLDMLPIIEAGAALPRHYDDGLRRFQPCGEGDTSGCL